MRCCANVRQRMNNNCGTCKYKRRQLIRTIKNKKCKNRKQNKQKKETTKKKETKTNYTNNKIIKNGFKNAKKKY